MKTNWIKWIAVGLALLMLALSAAGCSAAPLMTLDGGELSLNLYELMLSVQKGNMAYMINHWYGDVNSEEFWGTVIDEDSTTWDDYYTLAVYKKAKNLLAASVLFDEMGLTLPESRVTAIDEAIDKLIEEDAGSKKELNAILSQYGVNIKMYRQYKIMEARSQYLAEYLYGSGGSKIGAAVKEKFLQNNYVAFRQILIANYYYVFQTDSNGDIIYYTDTGAIAYDTSRGTAKLEGGKLVYYAEDGRIAYDSTAGKPSPVLDSNGEQKIEYYTKEQMKERATLAVDLMDTAGSDEAVFLALRNAYSDEKELDGTLDEGLCYLATNVEYASINMGFMDDIAAKLSELAVGETAIVPSDYGYHLVRRYATEQGAYADKELAQWFTDSTYGVYDFINNLENDLFLTVLAPYADRVVTDSELLDSISLKKVSPNYYYK